MTAILVYEQDNDPHDFCDLGVIETTNDQDRALRRRRLIDHRCEECKALDYFDGGW